MNPICFSHDFSSSFIAFCMVAYLPLLFSFTHRVLFSESPRTRVSIKLNSLEILDQLPKSVLDVSVETWEFLTVIGLIKMPPTSTSKWSWSILNTLLSATMRVLTGSATLSTSTERDVDLPQPVESTEVLEDQDTEPMDPLVDLVEQLGREETPRSCADTAKHFRFGFGICICIISFPMAITGLLDAI